jgi:Domain of unknown function (DUF1929)
VRRVNSLLGATFHGWAALGGFTRIFLYILIVIAGALISAEVFSMSLSRDKDRIATVDYGYGPGKGIGPPRPNLALGQTPAIPKSLIAAPSVAAAVPIGGAGGGYFFPHRGVDCPLTGGPSCAIPWPIIPLHMALLPDGRVISYGTDKSGAQGALLYYDVWNPKLGNGAKSHQTLSNTTQTDIFCSAASLLGSGGLLITGGNITANVEVFSPQNNTLTASGTMNYPRYYPSHTILRNGDKLVLGGISQSGAVVPTPEIFNPPSGSWTPLPGISTTDPDSDWFYPRGFVGFDGAVYILHPFSAQIFRLTTDGAGTIQYTGVVMAPGDVTYPSVMFSPFSVLTERLNKVVQVVDLSSSTPGLNGPCSTPPCYLQYDHIWGNGTLLADGEVLVSGGSAINNQIYDSLGNDVDAYQVEIYNPASGTWTLGDSASQPRLYHSAALLLPDGSVLTGGGGAPGPVNELNVEIYYPAYLYLKDGSGNPAPRPTIVSAPSTLKLGQTFSVKVGPKDRIGAVNLIKLGSATHAFNPEQRFIPVSFSQSGQTVTGIVDAAPEKIPPGYYMLFVLNTGGVPAVAKIVSVPSSIPPSPASQPYFLALTGGTIRTDWTGPVGFDFIVGPRQITVTSLGRWVLAGNTQSHLLQLTDAPVGSPGTSRTVFASATLNTAEFLAGEFAYVDLATPVVLSPNTKYAVWTTETGASDGWYNSDTTLTNAPDATVVGAVWLASGPTGNVSEAANGQSIAFGPPTFKYTIP